MGAYLKTRIMENYKFVTNIGFLTSNKTFKVRVLNDAELYTHTSVGNRNSLVSILNRLWAGDSQLISRQRQKVQTLFGVNQGPYAMGSKKIFPRG
jgi:hypothetical protein